MTSANPAPSLSLYHSPRSGNDGVDTETLAGTSSAISALSALGTRQGANMPTRLLLVDDHQIVRKGLRAILEQQPTLQIVGEANTGLEAVEMAIRLKPEVVLMDISLPGL